MKIDWRKGFTLVELLIVIAILGILGGGIIAAINPLAKINSANLAKAKTFAASVENGLAFDQVGKWSFEDGADLGKDTSGYSNNGVPTALTQQSGCVFGSCGNFNGSTSKVEIAYKSALNIPADFTISAWIYKSSNMNREEDIVRRAEQYALALDTNSNIIDSRAGNSWNGVSWKTPLNQWIHLVVTYNPTAGFIKYYVNGALLNQVSRTGNNTIDTSAALKIGTYYDPGLNLWFSGLIDDVAVYNQALSLSQIQQLYAQGAIKHQLAVK